MRMGFTQVGHFTVAAEKVPVVFGFSCPRWCHHQQSSAERVAYTIVLLRKPPGKMDGLGDKLKNMFSFGKLKEAVQGDKFKGTGHRLGSADVKVSTPGGARRHSIMHAAALARLCASQALAVV